jgi:ribonuclease P protein component
MKRTYGKQEKLKRKKLIEQLFVEGSSVSSFPLRFVYLKKEHKGKTPLMLGVSVAKRNVHKAVHRNRIKRVIREAYRLEKQLFLDSLKAPYIGMLLYQGKQGSDQALVHSKIKAIASKFSDKIKEDSTNASLKEPNKKH